MDIKNVKMVIFDMDGLMLDTEQCYYYGVKEMCEKKKIKKMSSLLFLLKLIKNITYIDIKIEYKTRK